MKEFLLAAFSIISSILIVVLLVGFGKPNIDFANNGVINYIILNYRLVYCVESIPIEVQVCKRAFRWYVRELHRS